MNFKLLLRVGFLVTCLVIAIGLMNFVSSGSFKNELNNVFTSNVKTMKWCPDNVVDFQWFDHLPSSLQLSETKILSLNEIEREYCRISMDSIESVATKLTFKPLLLAKSATAKTVLIEWEPQTKLFRVQGIVFRSEGLFAKLNKP